MTYLYMQDYKIVSPCFRPKDGTGRFRPAEMEAELHLMRDEKLRYGVRMPSSQGSVDVRWRNCGRKLEIVYGRSLCDNF